MPQPIEELNQSVLRAEYAVRGAVVIRAAEIEQALKEHPQDFPFSRISYLNIGNPQASGLGYMRFMRDLQSLCIAPHLLEQADAALLQVGFSQESIDRARQFIKENPRGLGPYTHSKGYLSVRKEVARFIEKRDGFPSDPESIFLSNGASSAIKDVIQLISGPGPNQSAMMIPIPQYPLYSAAMAMSNCVKVGYELEEEQNWDMPAAKLEQLYTNFHKENPGTKIRAFAVINPSNPCGAVLSQKAMTAIIQFCGNHDLMLLADEVYQENLYHPTADEPRSTFCSFKRALRLFEKQTGGPGPVLISFHSVSKGFLGECGLRGGYMEVVNCPGHIMNQLYKVASISLCSNTVGQLAVSVMVNPPANTDYEADSRHKIDAMERKAQLTYVILNQNAHINCQKVQGAMYAFPNLELPEKFVKECEHNGEKADNVYCMRLLESEGVCCVSGSGFLQKAHTWHLRMNILEDEALMPEVLQRISTFHDKLWAKYQ